MKRELDKTTRPVPMPAEVLDSYIDRYLMWLENELLAIVVDATRRQIRRAARRKPSLTSEEVFAMAGVDYRAAQQGHFKQTESSSGASRTG